MAELEELLKRKNELTTKISEIDSSVNEILAAIDRQKIYTFKNLADAKFVSKRALFMALAVVTLIIIATHVQIELWAVVKLA